MNASTKPQKDDDWEVRVRHTVSAPLEMVWPFLLDTALPLWLGEISTPLTPGAAYTTADNISGTVVSIADGSRIRVTWRPDEWDHDSVLQLTVKPATGGTTIDLKHDKLADRDERKIMLGHWKGVVKALDDAIITAKPKRIPSS